VSTVKSLLAFRAAFQQRLPAKPMKLTQPHQRGHVRRSLAGLLGLLSVLLAGSCSLRAAPANDGFSAAQLIVTASVTLTGTNLTATREAGEPAHAGSTSAATVWFRWTAPATREAALDTVGSDFDTVLAVYTGTALGNLALVAANDDIEIGRTFQSCVRFAAQAGTTYLIALAGFEGAAGSYTLNLNAGNDNFADAQVLTGASGTVTGQNIAASKEPGEPAHAGNRGGRSVWFRWTAPASGSFSFDTSGSPQGDTVLAAYTGTALTNLQLVAADDDDYLGSNSFPGFYGPSRVVFDSVAGETYFLALDGKDGMALGYVLNWRPEPALPVIALFSASTNLIEGDDDLHYYLQASVSGFGVGAQWLKDEQPATNLPNGGSLSANGFGGSRGFASGVTTNDQGTYRVLATNYAGSVLSDPVVITVTTSLQSTNPRTLFLVTNLAPVAPGGRIAVPIHWTPRGNEQAVSFSIAYDRGTLTFRGLSQTRSGGLPVLPPAPDQSFAPAPAGTTLNTNQLAQGRLGVQITEGFPIPEPHRSYELVTLHFDAVQVSNTAFTVIGFENQPVALETRSTNNTVLPMECGGGMFEILVSWEGDASPERGGDGQVNQQDFIALCRRLMELDGRDQELRLPFYAVTSATGSSQGGQRPPFFQRASSEGMRFDCWPRTNGGDGQLTFSDVVQAGRYAAGLDPLIRAAAATAEPSSSSYPRRSVSATNVAPRRLYFQTPTGRPGTNHELSVRMTAAGDENAVAFSVSGFTGVWSPGAPGGLYNKSARAGADLGNAMMFVSQSGFLLIKPPGETFPAGELELVRLLLAVPASYGVPAGKLGFVDYPTTREVVNAQAEVLPAVFSEASLPYFHSLANQRVESSSFRFQVTSETGRRYILEASENMRTWFPIATNTATTESLELQETFPPGAGRRFYRLVSP
jgi:hypothetical protein